MKQCRRSIGIPKETIAGEKRVATAPDVVEKLISLGFSVAVESGAGDGASFYDDAYARRRGEDRCRRGEPVVERRHRLQGARADSTDEVA